MQRIAVAQSEDSSSSEDDHSWSVSPGDVVLTYLYSATASGRRKRSNKTYRGLVLKHGDSSDDKIKLRAFGEETDADDDINTSVFDVDGMYWSYTQRVPTEWIVDTVLYAVGPNDRVNAYWNDHDGRKSNQTDAGRVLKQANSTGCVKIRFQCGAEQRVPATYVLSYR